MRDSQSLLEQLLAFGGPRITLDDVHRMLGTAGDRRLSQLARHLADRNAAGALAELDAAVAEGVDIGPLLDQLLGYFRDMMVAAVGCPAESLLYASSSEQAAMMAAGKQLGLETVLAVMQILDQTISRLRYSTHGRILAELAVVRICNLENLERLSGLIGQLRDGLPSPPRIAAAPTATPGPVASDPAKKKFPGGEAPSDPQPPEAHSQQQPPGELRPQTTAQIWSEVLARLSGMLADHARTAECRATSAPNRLAVFFPPAYTFSKSFCERPEHLGRLERLAAEVAGQSVRIEFGLLDPAPTDEARTAAGPRRMTSPGERLSEKVENPLVRRAIELFAARPVRLEEPEPKVQS
jgi:DNA polymerase-3 subunit gamma/tau